jgi:osmotically-inducible protein OsmY
MTPHTVSPRLPSRRTPHRHSLARALLAAAAASTLLGACAPILLGGAVLGTAMVVTDRRSSGTQLDDQAIELKSLNSVKNAVGDRGHVNVTSFNRLALITGEVPSEADKAKVETAIARIENVRSIVNELAIAGASSLTSRSNDTLLTGKVKASLVDAKDLQAHAFKVVTERGIVYLMGRVTEREAKRASDVARGVSGVQKVVRVFDIVTEAELAEIQPKPVTK